MYSQKIEAIIEIFEKYCIPLVKFYSILLLIGAFCFCIAFIIIFIFIYKNHQDIKRWKQEHHKRTENRRL